MAFVSKIHNLLQKRQLILNEVPHLASEKVSATSVDNWVSIALIAACTILSLITITLTLAFVLKTRALKRQIKVFAAAEFGSTPSALNRNNIPNTNTFSVEGSNPVINPDNRELPLRGDCDQSSR